MSGVPDCLACGTCCFSSLPTYVRVTGDDYDRLGDDAERLTTFIGHRCYMRLTSGHCVALDPSAQGFPCTVYASRPSACRTLERGSTACEAERHEKGERPMRLVVLLRGDST